ncbi:MAG: bifunctional [glutamine synthetase] adenylyltransferase/[glutamine synthetase]-adenylyl-L-tyrosine phosphorylase [Rhodobiaceae bacterium]|nr:bifunctional [glutamine synthetase] adenylyltransferase/[glutamine synthetase]-adenylyl-L-tyrosine phosphorylase [Rhodobiaceae bacterium]
MTATLAPPRPTDAHPDGVTGRGWVSDAVLSGVAAASPFLTTLIARDPERFEAIADAEPGETLSAALATMREAVATAGDEAAAMRALRRYRKVLALTAGLADLSGKWSLQEVTTALAEGADAALDAALGFALRTAHKAEAPNPDFTRGYAVIAMGKHGALELNYSSDIDIIAVFDPEIAMVPEGQYHTKHFVKVTQALVRLLQTKTEDDYVFRVDLRLRPDPSSTPVAITFNGAMNYYEALGQNWERAAHIKARACAGDLAFGRSYLKALRPFIWRKHLDYAAIADIHAMKRQIHAVKGHGAIAVEGHNIKLGRGGIREIEFFVQTQQLIAAGRAPQLRVPQTLGALDALCESGWIEPATRDDMKAAYETLRSIENRLQMLRDEQTHILPTDPVAMTTFARFCGFPDRDAFALTLTLTMETVQRHYEALFAGEQALSGIAGNLVFTGVDPDPETVATLEGIGFKEPEFVWRTIAGWHHGRIPAMRTARARELLTELTPTLIEAVAETGTPDTTFVAFERFVAQLPAGIQVFSMLHANPKLTLLLMTVLGVAPHLATGLVRRPSLFGVVLDPRFFGELPDRATIADALDRNLSEATSYEEFLDVARLVGQDQAFLIGVRQLTGNLPHTAAGPAYSALADLLIDRLLTRAWDELRETHGDIPGGRVAVLGMGKLGSRQMTAASDLDMILIYDHDPDAQASDGRRPLAPTQYFARLTQRLIAALSAQTANGNLYEVDMRLRPSGRSGPVATRIGSFRTYQHEQAWTWEHMALTRARPICGDPGLMDELQANIREILCQPRDAGAILSDVADMRRRIGDEKVARTHWQLKIARGGLIDIEFIAQGLQLVHAPRDPSVLARATPDALAALEKAGALRAEDARVLLEALALFDAVGQRIAVCIVGDIDPETVSAGLRAQLCEAAALPDFATLDAHIKESEAAVEAIFDRCIGAASLPEAARSGAGNP